jgi:hypothetical protein
MLCRNELLSVRGRIAYLLRLDAPLFDLILEGPKGVHFGKRVDAILGLGHGEMDEGAVAQLQDKITNVVRRLTCNS